jgi:fatty-acyl-CoA synthase
MLRAADVETLIVGAPYKDSDLVQMVQTLCPEAAQASGQEWSCSKLPALRRLIAIDSRPGPGWLAWSELEVDSRGEHARRALYEREATVDPQEVHNIQFTSGTTGSPKGAMLTHRNVLMNAYYVGQRTGYSASDRVCVPVPFYHCFGCVLGTLVCTVYGAAMVVPAPHHDAEATLLAIASERCTSVYGVPTMFVSQLSHPDRARFDLSSLRTGIMAGSPCPLPLMEQVVSTLRAREITIGYGQTEASPIITQTSVDDPIEVRVGTVGREIPGVEVRIVDKDSRKDVPEGQTGELCTRGHNVMLGYYKNPEATARVIDAEGWLYTGDLARRTPDGNYRIVGRSKELIIRGGENIYPPEVEEYLHKHPNVAEAAVVGLPDAKYGEVVSAWIVAKPGTTITCDEILEFCREQIAKYKIPKYVFFISEFPRTVTGKVQKHILRERGIKELGLEDQDSTPTA